MEKITLRCTVKRSVITLYLRILPAGTSESFFQFYRCATAVRMVQSEQSVPGGMDDVDLFGDIFPAKSDFTVEVSVPLLSYSD